MTTSDTICAIATPPGAGGVGIVRVSGSRAAEVAEAVAGTLPPPRHAHYTEFHSADGAAIDSGLLLWFPGPHSFTGEDVVELQGHGGPIVMQMLLARMRELGARDARPGEFTERAFLNGRMDLAQAEAVADLIGSGSVAAARAAQRSLSGAFSEKVMDVQRTLTEIRVFVEAALDFPDEEIDFLAESDISERLEGVHAACLKVRQQARQGRLLRDGITIAIIGRPNAGKSSLLNALAGREAAIVTDLPGTTRDVLREYLALDGLPVHIADTAGIRETGDMIEAEGVRRARAVLAECDLVLLVLDAVEPLDDQLMLADEVPEGVSVIRVLNKCDLVTDVPKIDRSVQVSAKQASGLGDLAAAVQQEVGLVASDSGDFSARARHLDALDRAEQHILRAHEQWQSSRSGEMLAEELRLAQDALGAITGTMIADDLLGEIFSGFCIGK